MQDNHHQNLDQLYEALSQLMFELNMDFNAFQITLKQYYARNSYHNCETIARASLKSGIDRRFISNTIQNKSQGIKPSSQQRIMQQIKQLADTDTGLLNIIGKKSLTSIMNKVANGSTTVNSIIQELQALDYLENLGDQIRYIKDNPSNLEDKALHKLSTDIHKCINEYVIKRHGIDSGNGTELEYNGL